MNTYNYLLLVFIAVFSSSCRIDNHDLGQLTYERPNSNNTYCIYRITKIVEQPEGVGYSKGEFCIKCCLDQSGLWPTGAGNSCDSPIEFETSDGAKYEAKINDIRDDTCMNCPDQVEDGYACPQ